MIYIHSLIYLYIELYKQNICMQMKTKILEALKAKFTGVSDSILNRIADKAANTVTKEEAVASYVEGVTLQQIFDSYGDSRATDAAKSAVSTYEEKHSLKDGQKIGGGSDPKPADPKPTPGDDLEAKVNALFEAKLKPFTDKIQGYEAKEKATLRQTFITNKAKELLIPDWRITEGFTISDTDDEAAITQKLTVVKQNLVTAGLDKKETGAFQIASTGEEQAKDLAKSWAQGLPDM